VRAVVARTLLGRFRDQQAGAEHANSEHFRAGLAAMRPALSRTPQITHTQIGGRGLVGDV
jgi:quinol monooxygenase YgiN